MGRLTFWKEGIIVLALSMVFCQGGFAAERYVVKQGDTLYEIAKRYGVSVEALKKANGLEKSELRLKQTLTIPVQGKRAGAEAVKKPGETVKQGKKPAQSARNVSVEREAYAVKKGDTVFSVAKKAGLSVDEIRRTNGLRSDTLNVGQVLAVGRPRNGEEGESAELDDEEEGAGVPLEVVSETEEKKPEFGDLMGKWKSEEERNLFVRVVKTFLGAPYRLGGSSLKGLDCSAFVKRIYEAFNITLPRTSREQCCVGKVVGKDDLQEGDLVFFKNRRANNTNHVGIYIGNNEFIHASSRKREVKVDNLDEPYFQQRFFRGVRVKEVERES
jgi:peptidoglycan DL-endopeptidase LytE